MNLKDWSSVTIGASSLLSEKLGVTKTTSCNLISGRQLPSKKQQIAIDKLIEKSMSSMERKKQKVKDLKQWDAVTNGSRQLLASRLGVTQMTISNLVTGKYKPSLEQILAINEVTGLTVGQLDAELASQIEAVMERGVL